ncbi:MAG: PAS domain S-box protein, partial [Proteobacteria bacterium]|nr:PAS domain S-box protein [Pseudomonadota bacterium]
MNERAAASWLWLRDIVVALILVAIAASLYAYYGRNAGGVLPMSVCYLAVIAAAVLAGRRGGFAAIVAVLAVAWLVPQAGLDSDPPWIVVFTVIASLVVLLISQSREQRRVAIERQAHLTTVLRGIDDGVIAIDDAERVRYFNPAAEHLLGVSARHAQGRAIAELVPGLDAAAFDQPDPDAGGGTHLATVVIDAPLPAIGSLAVTSIRLRSSSKDALGRLLFIRRRSDQHEAALALSERKLRAVFETDLWGICFTDLAGQRWLGNRAFRRMLLGEADLDQALHWDRLPDASSPMGLRQTLQRAGGYGPREVQVLRPDGSSAWLLLTAVVVAEDEVALLAVDVTERKRIDSTLRTQRLLMRSIIDRIPAFIGYLDRGRRYRLFNSLYEEWYPGKGIQGAKLSAVHEPEMLKVIAPYLDRAFAGETVRFPATFHRAGMAHHFDVHYVPHQPGEEVEGVVVHAHDISDRIRAAGAAPPGATAVLPFGPFPAGWIEGYVETDPDALRADDRRWFAARVRLPPRVHVPGTATPFLAEALDVLEASGRLRRAPAGEADVVLSLPGAR